MQPGVLSFSINPLPPSSSAPGGIVFQVHNAIDRLVTRKSSRSLQVRLAAPGPEDRRPLVVVLVVAVKGCIQRGGDRTRSIFDICLSVVLWDLRNIGGFRLVEGFIRNLCQLRLGTNGDYVKGRTHGQSHNVCHQRRKHSHSEDDLQSSVVRVTSGPL